MWIDFGWAEITALLTGICCFSIIIMVIVVSLITIFNLNKPRNPEA